MISADVQSTAATTPGKRYLLGINNVSGSAVNPAFTGSVGTVAVVPENSTTAFTVASTAFKWITFYAVSEGVDIGTTDAGVSWALIPID